MPTQEQQLSMKTVTDPVCGMKVVPEEAKWKTEHAGRTWYFCGQSCLKKFEAEP